MATNRDDVAGLVARLEERRLVPDGDGERFDGYGVMALPFASGHLLAMRRFPASSMGPGYSSVWHRDPDGSWTFWSDRPPLESCPRYFGSVITRAVVAPITVRWPAERRLEIAIPTARLEWSLQLESTLATRLLNRIAALLPERAWRSPRTLGLIATIAGRLLGAGRLGLSGRVPNGQRFMVNPRQVWVIDKNAASLDGRDLGPMGALARQVRLGDFWIPQRGLFALGRALFETTEPSRHRLVADARERSEASARRG